MWQIFGMKVCVLTWRGLANILLKDVFLSNSLCSDTWLNCKKSTDAIVPRKNEPVRGKG
jgi:hypothetical protein